MLLEFRLIPAPFVPLLLFVSAITCEWHVVLAELDSVCNGCWCQPGADGVCPEFNSPELGYVDTISSEVVDAYSSFTLSSSSPSLSLTAEDGSGDCYPFAGMETNADYAESDLPACVVTPSQDGTVCGYKYLTDGSGTMCSGREYELVTYASTEAAEADGAFVVHTDACGVCSNAQDVAIRMNTKYTLKPETTLCTTQFVLAGGDFQKLTNCVSERLGLTEQCSRLWAHYLAAVGGSCVEFCATSTDQILFSDETCVTGRCYNCSNRSPFSISMESFSGFKFQNSGMSELVPQSCEQYTNVVHDPCIYAVKAEAEAEVSTIAANASAADDAKEVSESNADSTSSDTHETRLPWTSAMVGAAIVQYAFF